MTTTPQEHGSQLPLHRHVEISLRDYLEKLNGETPANLYRMVVDEVEKPLLAIILEHAQGNQSRAAEMLGINRSTLRKKLRAHDLAN